MVELISLSWFPIAHIDLDELSLRDDADLPSGRHLLLVARPDATDYSDILCFTHPGGLSE